MNSATVRETRLISVTNTAYAPEMMNTRPHAKPLKALIKQNAQTGDCDWSRHDSGDLGESKFVFQIAFEYLRHRRP
jgi:hypothetical protein